MAFVTPAWVDGVRTSHCSARVPGSNHSSDTLPLQLVGAWISSREPSAVSTWLSPSVCGTVTSVAEPAGACLKTSSTPQAPIVCRYSPLDSCQASISPWSLLWELRGGVSAVGRPPLTGTSQSCRPAPSDGPQEASTVPLPHQRTGPHEFALVPGTGS